LHSTFKYLFESLSASFSFTFQITLNKWYWTCGHRMKFRQLLGL
jgi:hypothetical protein